MSDDQAAMASGSPSAASSAGEPLLPREGSPEAAEDGPAVDEDPHASSRFLVSTPSRDYPLSAAREPAASGSPPRAYDTASQSTSAEEHTDSWGAGASGHPSSMRADPAPRAPEAAGGSGSMHDTAVNVPMRSSLPPHEFACDDDSAAHAKSAFAAGIGMPKEPRGGPGYAGAGHSGAGCTADSAALLSQRVDFYRQAWRYYGEHLSHKEFHPWAMLAVLLAGMITLGCLSNSSARTFAARDRSAAAAAAAAGARVQIAACCWAAGFVLTILYFRMSRLQLTNRDFAVQCANASVVALQRTMHEMRHACMRTAAAGGPPESPVREGDGLPGEGGYSGNGVASASTDVDAPAAYSYGHAGRRRMRAGVGASVWSHEGGQYDAVWAEFVGKLQRSMREGAAEYPVALQGLLNWLGAVVCVAGLFGASLPLGVNLGGRELPAVNFAVAVVAVGVVWRSVHSG